MARTRDIAVLVLFTSTHQHMSQDANLAIQSHRAIRFLSDLNTAVRALRIAVATRHRLRRDRAFVGGGAFVGVPFAVLAWGAGFEAPAVVGGFAEVAL